MLKRICLTGSALLLSTLFAGGYDSRYGPVIGTALKVDGHNVAFRGQIVPLGEKREAGLCFDTDTMRVAGAWLEPVLKLEGLPFSGGHGAFPRLTKPPLFACKASPGWMPGAGVKPDPRLSDEPEGSYPALGPLPADWAQYRGCYLHGEQVVFHYTVGSTEILESHSAAAGTITRHFQVGAHEQPLTLVLADERPGLSIALSGDAAVPALQSGQWVVVLKPNDRERLLSATYGMDAAKAVQPMALRPLTKGGPARWQEKAIVTQGVVSTDDRKPYVIDKLTRPQKPFGLSLRIGGLDFFSDPTRAAVCTWDGDVWIIEGIDADLDELTWTRFAAGQHETLGLKIVDDVIYTVADDQITRYHDFNRDGEADYYECFNNQWDLTSGFHAFCFDLHTDPEGFFYFAFGSPVRSGGRSFERMGRHHGSILRVSKDGRKTEIYASGLRAPNGMCVSPDGQVTTGDNEGTFVPRCPINWVKPGDFLGVVDSYADRDKLKTTPTVAQRANGRAQHLEPAEMPRPLAWLPKGVDNSGGGQAWVTSDQWGPFAGELLHMSYGQSALYLVLKEERNGQMQGGVVKFPLRFTSSAMRARFNAGDGQLYVAGLKGWQSNAASDGGVDRVRYTGATVAMPSRLSFNGQSITLGFTQKLDVELANDPTSYSLRAKNIKWTHGYGSGESPVSGDWKVKKAQLLEDGQSVRLEVPGLQPAHLLEISLDLETEDGDEIITKIHSTIHEL